MGLGMLLSGAALVMGVGFAMWNARKRTRAQKPARSRSDYWRKP
jgi:hypothetical protein